MLARWVCIYRSGWHSPSANERPAIRSGKVTRTSQPTGGLASFVIIEQGLLQLGKP